MNYPMSVRSTPLSVTNREMQCQTSAAKWPASSQTTIKVWKSSKLCDAAGVEQAWRR